MKTILKADVPPAFSDYVTNNPLASWETFRDSEGALYRELVREISVAQGGLCAYCEIDLHFADGDGLDDVRVEHFRPKSLPYPPNWALDWENLLCVCRGGSCKGLGKNARWTSPDHSCDVPKGQDDLHGIILNPLTDIPPDHLLFSYSREGMMNVSSECPSDLRDRATNSIIRLRLTNVHGLKPSATRLSRLRKEAIAELDQIIDEYFCSCIEMHDGNMPDDELEAFAMTYALSEVSTIIFPNIDDLPTFFSCMRSILGGSAEARLQAIGYY